VIDVIANDTDVDSESLTIKSTNYTGKGSAIIENNKISYSPEIGFIGIEKITYLISARPKSRISDMSLLNLTA
jgi:hypothetical protein